MLKRSLLIFLFLISSIKVFATSFQAMPLEKLIDESSGAAEVELRSKKSFMNNIGLIFTEYTFAMSESYNVENSDLDGEFLKITMTGGTVNGVTSFIDGAPDFSVGEKSFLLLKKIDSKMYISNFTMGKYKVENREGQIYYVSSVFPYDGDIGQVKKERMIDLVKTKFKITRIPESDGRKSDPVLENKKTFAREKVFEKRSPAQVGEEEQDDGVVAMWSFFALMVVSGLTMWWKLKKGSRV